MNEKKENKTMSTDISTRQQHLETALNTVEKERQMFNALCINYTAAYCCDLMTDYMESIKQKDFSHSAHETGNLNNRHSYSEWIRYAYDHIVIKEFSPDYLEIFDATNIMKRLQTEESFVYRHKTLPNAAGMEYFETTVVRLYTDEHSFKVIVGYRPIDDILAEEKKHQKELEDALQATRIANRTKTDFLRRMSHDIRTPLNGIIGLLEINEAHFDNIELLHANHKKMKTSANHLLSLINDILQMSKLEDGSITLAHEPIDLIDLTKDIVTIVIDRAIESGLHWDYEKGKSFIPYPYIYGSPLHIRQIFLNIYGNCIKYNRPGGHINTIVDAFSAQDGFCTYRWTISDTGVGMSEEFLNHIFEPFSQEKSDARSIYHGTGLGMSIVKNLIDQMGGTISITSEEGVGSTFVITLPFEIALAPSTTQIPETLAEPSVEGLHLLLAEDNDLNAEIAEVLLTDKGSYVTVVENGKQAIETFASNPPGTFDAILMDIMMPVMDGITAAKEIRSMNHPDSRNIPIISMTANAFLEDTQKCLDAGMNAHLTKPLQMEKVVATISQFCKQRK